MDVKKIFEGRELLRYQGEDRHWFWSKWHVSKKKKWYRISWIKLWYRKWIRKIKLFKPKRKMCLITKTGAYFRPY